MKALAFILFFLGSGLLFAQNTPIVTNASLRSDAPNILFRGFENILEVKSKLGDTNTYLIEGDDCIILTQRNDETPLKFGQYIVKPVGRARVVQIKVYDRDHPDEVVMVLDYAISNLPDGTVYLDDVMSGGELSTVKGKLSVRRPEDSPYVGPEKITKWNLSIGGKEFAGTGNSLTTECIQALKEITAETTILLVCTAVGEDGITRKRRAQFTIR